MHAGKARPTQGPVGGTRWLTTMRRRADCGELRLLLPTPLHPSQSAGRVASSGMRAAPVGTSLLASTLHGQSRHWVNRVG